MRFWYDKEPGDQNGVKIIAIRYSNCGKETVLSMNNSNINYKDIIMLIPQTVKLQVQAFAEA